VGRLKPNDFGLFYSLGNVFTWCQGRFKEYSNSKGIRADDDEEDMLIVDMSSRA
jgi:hypothetical protein